MSKDFNTCAMAIYMPYWLLHIPNSDLSLSSKILYGRLLLLIIEKEAGEKLDGDLTRSLKKLAKDINLSFHTITRSMKELRDVKLIETYRMKLGGVNYYKFLDHQWKPKIKHKK